MAAKIIPNAFQSPNDYVDIAMELLSGEEYKCLSFAARHILGWQDKINSREGVISLSMFEHGYADASGTRYGGSGVNRATLIAALENLVTYGLLVKIGDPTPDGQRWQLGASPDWNGLLKRRDERIAAMKQRTSKGRAVAQAKRAEAAGLSDRPLVYAIDQQESIAQTGAGLSDRLNQNQSKPIQIQSDSDAPRANIFTLYEQVFGLIPPTVVDALKDAMQEFPEDWIADAFEITRKRRGRSWSYTRTILDNWKKFGRDPQPPVKDTPAAKPQPAKADPLKARIEEILKTLPEHPPADYLPDDPQRVFAWQTTGRRAVARQMAEKDKS